MAAVALLDIASSDGPAATADAAFSNLLGTATRKAKTGAV